MNCVQQDDFPVLKGPYLGQTPPGMIPEVFAPGIISTGYSERIAAFTPDGKEFYYALWGAPHGVILFMKEINGVWIKPQVAPFSGKYIAEFNMSPDGNKILFSSNRPLDGRGEPINTFNIWIVERNDIGWDEPKKLCSGGYPTISSNGNLYFNDDREGGIGAGDLYMSEFIDGSYKEPNNLGNLINSESNDADPFIAPDESYLIFASDRSNVIDLYISFRKKDGSWIKAINMGEKINTSEIEICPSVTPNGKYFFFTSYRSFYDKYSRTPLTFEGKTKILSSPGNGNGDIYWVDAGIIEELKPDELR
jgi:Tol biopolymer transport system component